jgi:hypothetical protein
VTTYSPLLASRASLEGHEQIVKLSITHRIQLKHALISGYLEAISSELGALNTESDSLGLCGTVFSPPVVSDIGEFKSPGRRAERNKRMLEFRDLNIIRTPMCTPFRMC